MRRMRKVKFRNGDVKYYEIVLAEDLKRYEVDVECQTQDSRIQKAYQGTRTNVEVCAINSEEARDTAVACMEGRWKLHEGLQTKWIAHNVRELGPMVIGPPKSIPKHKDQPDSKRTTRGEESDVKG
jgi:hypothetical protein